MFFLFFFLFGALGYLCQDAIDAVINKLEDVPFPKILNLLLYSTSCGFVGVLIGLVIYWLSKKVNPLFQIKFINLFLLLSIIFLSSLVIVKPFYENLNLFDSPKRKIKPNNIARNELGLIKSEINNVKKFNLKKFKECMAFDIRDTLDVFADGANTISIRQTANSRFYTYQLPNDNITDVKATLVKTKKGQKYLVILALMRPISGFSSLLVFNKYGQCLYEELFNNFQFSLSKNERNEILLSKQEMVSDSAIFIPQYIFKF